MAFRTLLGKTNVPTIKALVVSFGLVVGFGFVSTGAGCGASLGTECTLTSDCPVGLYCVFGMCVNACNDSIDCNPLDTDAICVKVGREDILSDDPNTPAQFNVCQKPKTCAEDSEGGLCAKGQSCVDGQCWRQCNINEPCPGTDACVNAICIPANDDGGIPEKVVDEGKPCAINSDCATMLCGLDGFCKACRATGDCFADALCLEGNCVGTDGYHGEDIPDGTSSSSGESHGDGVYTNCGECTHTNTGAYWHQCKPQMDTCIKDETCAKILACSLNGGPPDSNVCTTNEEGGYCTTRCITDVYPYSSELSIQRFYALDSCVYCQTNTCKALCTDQTTLGTNNPLDATGYCSVICQQPGSVCE